MGLGDTKPSMIPVIISIGTIPNTNLAGREPQYLVPYRRRYLRRSKIAFAINNPDPPARKMVGNSKER